MSPDDLPGVYETPRPINDLAECSFYHTMDIPGYGHVQGDWDLRQAAQDCLGHMTLQHKRVLEIGPASGFLSFYMESKGAQVVACDLSDDDDGDRVPLPGIDPVQTARDFKAYLHRVRNSFWLCHRAYTSSVKAVYSSVYKIPDEVGAVDIALFSCVLLHLRDPFYALQKVARLTKETIVVTEPIAQRAFPFIVFTELLEKVGLRTPLMMFAPFYKRGHSHTWWYSTPAAIRQFVEVLGFGKHATRFHARARTQGHRFPFYTVVSHRTDGFGPGESLSMPEAARKATRLK